MSSERPVLSDRELVVLGALAEALIPTDDTPGAQHDWAIAFVRRQAEHHAEDAERLRALAAYAAGLAPNGGFERLPIAERELRLRVAHPTLRDDPELAPDVRDCRAAMRGIMTGFLIADDLDGRDDPFARQPSSHHDRMATTSPTHTTTEPMSDLAIDRRMATSSGRGVYGRVWMAAGYPHLPGLPQRPEDLAEAPVALGSRRQRE
jgi:hypothetical protein